MKLKIHCLHGLIPRYDCQDIVVVLQMVIIDFSNPLSTDIAWSSWFGGPSKLDCKPCPF